MKRVRVFRRLAGVGPAGPDAGRPSAFAAPGVQPTVVSTDADPGTSFDVTTTVTTEEIPPNPDIVFLADTTGSMGVAIGDVKTNINDIIADVEASRPTAQFGVAEYRDEEHCAFDPFDVRLDQAVTDDNTAVVNAVDALGASGGCDIPENGLVALNSLATDPSVGFRTDSTRIIVWFGDAPQHVDADGPTVAETIDALVSAGIRVIAIDVGALDSTGQATAITEATGGVLLPAGGDVSAAILAGLSALPSRSLPRSSLRHGSLGELRPHDADGHQRRRRRVHGDHHRGRRRRPGQHPRLHGAVPDRRRAGRGRVHAEHQRGRQRRHRPRGGVHADGQPRGQERACCGQQPQERAEPRRLLRADCHDNVDPSPEFFVVDTGSGTVFGPFPSGTRIKYTEAPGAAPEQKPMGGPNSAVAYHHRHG